MNYRIEFHKQARKDYEKLKNDRGLARNLKALLLILEDNPFKLPCEKLSGNLSNCYSKRINIKHRLVYTVDKEKRVVRVLSMWTHYASL